MELLPSRCLLLLLLLDLLLSPLLLLLAPCVGEGTPPSLRKQQQRMQQKQRPLHLRPHSQHSHGLQQQRCEAQLRCSEPLVQQWVRPEWAER